MATADIFDRQVLQIGAACLFLLSMFASCQTAPTWTLTEKTRSCLIDTSALTEGWESEMGPGPYDRPERILPGRALEGAEVSFFQPEFGARSFHQVLLYRNKEKATRHFNSSAPFGTAGLVSPWETPDVPYESLVADQMRLECAELEVSRRFKVCVVWSQYGPYVSEFDTWISPEYMSMGDLANVLQSVDAKMTACIERLSDDS